MLRGTQTFAVPVNAGEYAPEFLTLGAQDSAAVAPEHFLGVTAVPESLPDDAIVEVWLPKAGVQGIPDPEDDYTYSGESTLGPVLTVPLASWPNGAQIRVQSGGTTGDAVVSGSVDK
jgi:hypothetical protein